MLGRSMAYPTYFTKMSRRQTNLRHKDCDGMVTKTNLSNLWCEKCGCRITKENTIKIIDKHSRALEAN